jgi:hypothetical protein
VQKREAKREKPREKHMKLALLCILRIFGRAGAQWLASEYLCLIIAGVDDDGLPDL